MRVHQTIQKLDVNLWRLKTNKKKNEKPNITRVKETFTKQVRIC